MANLIMPFHSEGIMVCRFASALSTLNWRGGCPNLLPCDALHLHRSRDTSYEKIFFRTAGDPDYRVVVPLARCVNAWQICITCVLSCSGIAEIVLASWLGIIIWCRRSAATDQPARSATTSATTEGDLKIPRWSISDARPSNSSDLGFACLTWQETN